MDKELILQRIIPVFLIIWAIINSWFHLSNNNPQGILWFCNTIIFLMALGFWFDNKIILSSAAVSYTLFGIAWTIDVISFFATGKFLLDVAVYISSTKGLSQIITFYHAVLLIFSLGFIIIEKKIYKHAWLISSAHLLIVLILSLLLTNSNVNCVRVACEIGKLNFLYALKPEFLPVILFNWAMFTVLGFIPIQLILSLVKKKHTLHQP